MTEQSDLAQKLKGHIDTLDGEIRRLDARLKVVETEARGRIQRTINDLWSQRGEAESRLDEVRRTSETAWSELRTGFERAFDEIHAGFRRARERGAAGGGEAAPAGSSAGGSATGTEPAGARPAGAEPSETVPPAGAADPRNRD